MRVYVERCAGYFRLTFKQRGIDYREFVSYSPLGDWIWDRGYAREALDTLENVYGIPRKNIRFEHY